MKDIKIIWIINLTDGYIYSKNTKVSSELSQSLSYSVSQLDAFTLAISFKGATHWSAFIISYKVKISPLFPLENRSTTTKFHAPSKFPKCLMLAINLTQPRLSPWNIWLNTTVFILHNSGCLSPPFSEYSIDRDELCRMKHEDRKQPTEWHKTHLDVNYQQHKKLFYKSVTSLM